MQINTITKSEDHMKFKNDYVINSIVKEKNNFHTKFLNAKKKFGKVYF